MGGLAAAHAVLRSQVGLEGGNKVWLDTLQPSCMQVEGAAGRTLVLLGVGAVKV